MLCTHFHNNIFLTFLYVAIMMSGIPLIGNIVGHGIRVDSGVGTDACACVHRAADSAQRRAGPRRGDRARTGCAPRANEWLAGRAGSWPPGRVCRNLMLPCPLTSPGIHKSGTQAGAPAQAPPQSGLGRAGRRDPGKATAQ